MLQDAQEDELYEYTQSTIERAAQDYWWMRRHQRPPPFPPSGARLERLETRCGSHQGEFRPTAAAIAKEANNYLDIVQELMEVDSATIGPQLPGRELLTKKDNFMYGSRHLITRTRSWDNESSDNDDS